MFMEKVVVKKNGSLLIPEEVRLRYGMKAGMKIILEETEDGILLQPMNEAYFEKFVGILEGNGNLKEEMKGAKKEERGLEERKVN